MLKNQIKKMKKKIFFLLETFFLFFKKKKKIMALDIFFRFDVFLSKVDFRVRADLSGFFSIGKLF
jgi:hypothetical protein